MQAPTVLYTLLMESCRPVSNRSTRIGVCARVYRMGTTAVEDTSFVLCIVDVEVDDRDKHDLKIVISTKRLLRLMIKTEGVQTDATYKLIWPIMSTNRTSESVIQCLDLAPHHVQVGKLGYYDVHNRGSGNCYISYGDCSASASSVSGSTNIGGYWIHNVYNAGSGSISITYCDESREPSNGKELINNVQSAGSGRIYIKYSCGFNPNLGRKLMNDLSKAGSARIYITYKNCCPTFSGVPSPSNICGKLMNNIRSQGSGIIDIKYWDCGASPSSVLRNSNNCGKLAHDVSNAGSGSIYITYWNCGGLPSSVPSNAYIGEKLVDSVQNRGSGRVDIKYGKCSASALSARSDTNIGAKLDKKLANVMPQEAHKLNPENERTRRLTFKHAS
ncbi:hypothetical protein AVEN_247695-1 [Araneus ventricosus]|uniref:Uncharacterized protein n=1 Tax=Araneus ventricosus TaxID=182803 RepID=A0A4Y2GL49_ARAVE|nr:hypothetical protein AVEN_247695-1 [Araneus ventricosus]